MSLNFSKIWYQKQMNIIISALLLVLEITDFERINKVSKKKHSEQFMPQEI